jgi:diaminohydroxyphosphoribosylaminopyrimidine deaminase/5-amino-6-(5-phosphoribosylamino)uracil reductase
MSRATGPFDPTIMEMAVALAKRSRPSPNPRVGAVVVKGGRVLGTGYHLGPGTPHAETVAIAEAGEAARGADLYVTLEPCVHHGRTGPCVENVLAAGISRVAIGMLDPDRRVNGKGVAHLRDHGLEVLVGLGEGACAELLKDYVTHRTIGRPGVTLKAAITLDGYIAATSGDSKWISSERSRAVVHEMRALSDAVLVGVDTVLKDDPLLTVRAYPGTTPLRVVLDSELRVPPTSQLVKSSVGHPLLIVHTADEDDAQKMYGDLPGVDTLRCRRTPAGLVDLNDLLGKLEKKGVLSLLVEGGAKVFSSFLTAGVVDEIVLFIAPRILGSGISWIAYPDVRRVEDGVSFDAPEITRLGDDILYRIRVRR